VTRTNGEVIETEFPHDGRSDGQRVVIETDVGLVTFHPSLAHEFTPEKGKGREKEPRHLRVVLEIPIASEHRMEIRANALPGNPIRPLGGRISQTHLLSKVSELESAG
jgi:hypothetical protein